MSLSKLQELLGSLPSMGVSRVLLGVAGVAAGAAILCNLPTNPFVPSPQKATLPYLSGIKLKTIEDKPRQFQAKELWEKGGAVIMAVRRPG